MVDASTSKNPRGTYTKKDKEDMMPKATLFSKLKWVGDTNIGAVNMIQLSDRLKEGKSPEGKKGATGCTILLMKLKMERESLIELGSYVKI